MAAQTYVWDHQSRAPQGARGLKYKDAVDAPFPAVRRAPQGVRGLK